MFRPFACFFRYFLSFGKHRINPANHLKMASVLENSPKLELFTHFKTEIVMKFLQIFILLIFVSQVAFGQAMPDSTYYNFWEGNWYAVENGKIDTTINWFKVKRGINPLVFEEDWSMGAPDNQSKAKGIRAWDVVNQTWQYIWMHESGLFQIWEGRKVGEHWYIYKHFNINGDAYLSRQVWLYSGDNELTRISEKSYDEGKTW